MSEALAERGLPAEILSERGESRDLFTSQFAGVSEEKLRGAESALYSLNSIQKF